MKLLISEGMKLTHIQKCLRKVYGKATVDLSTV